MALTITHTKVSAAPSDGDASHVQGSDWNASHVVTGTTDGNYVYADTTAGLLSYTVGTGKTYPDINTALRAISAKGVGHDVKIEFVVDVGHVEPAGIIIASPMFKNLTIRSALIPAELPLPAYDAVTTVGGATPNGGSRVRYQMLDPLIPEIVVGAHISCTRYTFPDPTTPAQANCFGLHEIIAVDAGNQTFDIEVMRTTQAATATALTTTMLPTGGASIIGGMKFTPGAAAYHTPAGTDAYITLDGNFVEPLKDIVINTGYVGDDPHSLLCFNGKFKFKELNVRGGGSSLYALNADVFATMLSSDAFRQTGQGVGNGVIAQRRSAVEIQFLVNIVDRYIGLDASERSSVVAGSANDSDSICQTQYRIGTVSGPENLALFYSSCYWGAVSGVEYTTLPNTLTFAEYAGVGGYAGNPLD